MNTDISLCRAYPTVTLNKSLERRVVLNTLLNPKN